jgi:hypothetical protein
MKSKHNLTRGSNNAIVSSWNITVMVLSDELVISETPTEYYYL